MHEFLQKKKIIDWVFKGLVVFTLAFMLVTPLFGDWFRSNMRLYSDISTILILATVAVTFFFSRFKKAGLFVSRIHAEIMDCGCYIPRLSTSDMKEYETAVYNRLGEDFFTLNSNVQLSEREFSFQAVKKRETLYFTKCKKLTAEELFAYSDAVSTAAAAANVRQKQTIILCIAAEQIDEEAISYSKMTTVLGKIEIIPVLVDLRASRAYFFNDGSKKLNFVYKNVLGYPEGIIPEECKQTGQLPFQKELERKMLLFDIKDYREGRFNPRA